MRIFGAYESYPKNAKRFQFSSITVVLGEPLHFTSEELENPSRENYQLLSNKVMQRIAALSLP
jgi:1-acyl-sn-glycerol-3-phosphate acyltransferase